MSEDLKTAVVTGYTGAIGREVVKALAESKRFEKVVLIGRRHVEYDDENIKALEQRVIEYEKLDELKEIFSGFDVAFCCLGTTRKEAGSAEAFRRIDHDYVLKIAQHCKDGGCKHFHYVSSHGANKDSGMLYTQSKGQTEDELAKLSFPRVSIYRPKLLLRGDKMRGGEKVIYHMTRCCECCFPHSMHTGCDVVANAMLNNCDTQVIQPTEILFNVDIYRLNAND